MTEEKEPSYPVPTSDHLYVRRQYFPLTLHIVYNILNKINFYLYINLRVFY